MFDLRNIGENGKVIESGKMEGYVNYTAYENGVVIVSGCGTLNFNLRDCHFHYGHKPEAYYRVFVEGNFDKVGYSAFFDWISLGQVVLPETIRVISERAFSDCDNLKRITLPGHIELIERGVFGYSGLEEVQFYDNIPVRPYLIDYFKSMNVRMTWRGIEL